jgi:nucleotide-binding universal stress UspA family protein
MGIADEIRNISVSLSNILFAMDFTPGSLRAYPYAADIAMHYGGKVLVAHIVPPDEGDAVPSAEQIRSDKLLAAAAEAGLNDSLGRLREVPHEVLIDHGDICEKVLATADKCKIDLVVIGTHGWRGFKKLLKGSTAEKISCLTTRPVLTAGPRVSRPVVFRRILYTTDLLDAAAHALPYALSLADEYEAELLFLHVNNDYSREPPVEASLRTFEFLRKHASEYSAMRVPDRSNVIVDFGPTADLILEHAAKRDVDLIVMGLHHQVGLKARIGAHLPGSTTYEVASQALCPVLAIPLHKHPVTMMAPR